MTGVQTCALPICNKKADGKGSAPDENYAREVMQLFTIGLFVAAGVEIVAHGQIECDCFEQRAVVAESIST